MIKGLLDLKQLSDKYGDAKVDQAFGTVINATFDLSTWRFRPEGGWLSVTYTL